jgi:carboxyl-terminal processing protease
VEAFVVRVTGVRRVAAGSIVCALLGFAVAYCAFRGQARFERPAEPGVARAVWRVLPPDQLACGEGEDDLVVLPSGAPTSLGCDEARLIVRQARASLAVPPVPVDPVRFADAATDWLDPHGLWSVAPDAPAGAAVRSGAARLLAEIEAPHGSGPCEAALEVGAALEAWSNELRATFDAAYAGSSDARTRPVSAAAAFRAASTSPYEDGAVTRGARELARALGRDAGLLRRGYGEALAPYVASLRARTAPELDADGWSRVVIAALARAYVPQLDAHGAWAPIDEELSIYDLGLEAHPPPRLWSDMTRTAAGVRVDRGALAPLEPGDVVLRVRDTPLTGISVEQAQQFAVVPEGADVTVTALRQGSAAPLELVVGHTRELEPDAPDAPLELDADLVRYADGAAAIVTIPDVPDDLGARLGATLQRLRKAGTLRGVLLDVRANGGGSTDGVVAALGYFLPGATLFPMRRRDGGIEVERAPDVPKADRWEGPLGVLVDGDSASAAEMLAGAIGAYRRGVVIGERTYGKGCAQEYLDDEAHAGVLRLTTLLYALPDGSPVQKTGILPELSLSLPPPAEREAMTERALGPWAGPDVRDRELVREVVWPAHGGRVGPCDDDTACRALRALGASKAAAR